MFLFCVREATAVALVLSLALPVVLALAAGAKDAREHPRCRAHTNCTEDTHTFPKFSYQVNGRLVVIKFNDSELFSVYCVQEGLAADEAALPALPRAAAVRRTEFTGCALPAGAYVAALAALNVSVTHELELARLPAAPRLARAHLTGLSVVSLKIKAAGMDAVEGPEDNFFADVQDLRALSVTSLALGVAVLRTLPVSLHNLALNNARLPAAEADAPRWLERLRELRILSLVERNTAGHLLPPLVTALPELTEMTVYGKMTPPPADWLRNSALKTLSLSSCGLTELPDGMFDGVNLTSLTISENNLTELRAGVFSDLRWLRSLDLSDNKLGAPSLKRTLPALMNLQELNASDNPLGSLCGNSSVRTREPSSLPRGLVRLELRDTGATRVCADWVDDSALQHIDLKDNRIEYLTYADVAMVRRAPAPAGPVRLYLQGNPLRELRVTRADVAACRAVAEPRQLQRVQVELKGELVCDCRHAWLRAALHDCASLLVAPDVSCASPPAAPAAPAEPARALLMHYQPDDLLCPYTSDCTPSCACGKRARDNATVVRCSGALPADARWPTSAARWPLALHVPGAGLRAVPSGALVELYAANNSIISLDAGDIPETLQVLDVRHNRIGHISEAAALRLARPPAPPAPPAHPALRRVLLSGNPLVCECALYPALLHLRAAKIKDWSEMQCKDLRFVHVLVESDLCPSVLPQVLAGVLSALLLLATAGLLLWRYRPWERSPTDFTYDPNKTHDVFISYAYPDHALAARLLRHLEAHGYSTVEHCRDWLPGSPVSEQITQSVMCARVTLLLVTDNYAKSNWCMDEFRAAHAHTLKRGSARVVPVRCALSSKLPDDLRLYLNNNTYLSWDDADFWDKLRDVLPLPCQPAELINLVPLTVQELAPAPEHQVELALQAEPAPAPPAPRAPRPTEDKEFPQPTEIAAC